MSYLEPPRHGGGGGSPDKKRLHMVFLYVKFVRIAVIFGFCYTIADTIRSSIVLSMVDIELDIKIWGIVPITNDAIFYGNIVIATIMTLVFIYVTILLTRKYRIIKNAHLAYCNCDRKRWYNRE